MHCGTENSRAATAGGMRRAVPLTRILKIPPPGVCRMHAFFSAAVSAAVRNRKTGKKAYGYSFPRGTDGTQMRAACPVRETEYTVSPFSS